MFFATSQIILFLYKTDLMESLDIASSSRTPGVSFKANGQLAIKGISTGENPHEFFMPALKWIEGYSNAPAHNTTLELFLPYFNTGTSKALLNIMYMLRDAAKNRSVNVKVRWIYEQGDVDMSDAGLDYEQIVKIPFEHIAVKAQ